MYKPWGKYEILTIHENFKVKILTINPGAQLSLQSHRDRDEHWVVVKGEATTIVDKIEAMVKCGEATIVPRSFKHRISNNTTEEVIIVETQIGTNLDEDDIIRYEDKYGRTS